MPRPELNRREHECAEVALRNTFRRFRTVRSKLIHVPAGHFVGRKKYNMVYRVPAERFVFMEWCLGCDAVCQGGAPY
jgi:hypothetical protein